MRSHSAHRTTVARRLSAWPATAALSLAAAAAVMLAAQAGQAAEREHGAHVHGVSRLNVAVEGQTVEMELMSPGDDIVGFEHAAESTDDKAAVEDAVTALKKGDGLFAFPRDAGCRLEEAAVESGLLEADHHHGKEHGGHEMHEHGKDGAEHAGEEHAEFHVQYRFHCTRPDRLDHIDVKLFQRFPAARAVEVQTITSGGQRAQELTPASSRLNF